MNINFSRVAVISSLSAFCIFFACMMNFDSSCVQAGYFIGSYNYTLEVGLLFSVFGTIVSTAVRVVRS